MKQIKHLIKSLIPPLLAEFLKGFFRNPVWDGNYKNWTEAKKNSSGYDSSLILERVRSSLHEVKAGKAVFERDSVLFHKPDEQYCLLSALLYCSSKSGNTLNVVDFGGSLGSTYYQLKSILKKVPLTSFSWSVIEQPHFSEVGNREFSDDKLHFFTDIASALGRSELPGCRVLLMSASLQYLERPFEQLQKIINEHNFDFVVMARIPIHFESGARLTVQNVPASIYPASYPCWFFNEDEFLSLFAYGYEEILKFNAPDCCFDFPSTFKGFLFERKKNDLKKNR